MPTFNYIARDSEGTRKDGSVDAADRNAAMLLLQQMGCTPLSLTPAKGSAPSLKTAKGRIQFKFSTGQNIRMKPRGMLLFTRELADLLSSGMTLGRALHTQAKRGSETASSKIIQRLRDEVVQGSALSDALRIYPDSFPKLYVSMVRAGEASGALGEALQGLCTHYERAQEAKNKVITAMIYPSIVLLVGILSVVGLMVFIIPKFSSIFDELGGTMPLPTRILMGLSNGMIQYGWLLILLLVGGGIAFSRYIKTPTGRTWLDARQLKMPVVCKSLRLMPSPILPAPSKPSSATVSPF